LTPNAFFPEARVDRDKLWEVEAAIQVIEMDHFKRFAERLGMSVTELKAI
jgi:hypothetical protein